VVVVLREPVSRRDDRVLVALAVDVLVGRERLRDRVRGDFRMEEVVDGRLERFVVLRERSVGELRREEAPDPLGIHDEGAVLAGRGIRLEVRDVADPETAVPLDARTARIPRLALAVRGGAVVHDAAVRRPRETPVVVHAETGWIRGGTARR